MRLFTTQLVGGPKDGERHSSPQAPENGMELVKAGHVYRFEQWRAGRPAFVHVGPLEPHQ